jgi:uncharacterized protein YbaR (Trm112 family)
MFIELTDHLRCPEDHEEAYLVLLPDSVVQRSVLSGELGCPVCHRTLYLRDGILDTADGPPAATMEPTLDGASVAALTGLGGPGGYLVLVGPVAGGWREVEAVLNGVSMVAVNGPASLTDAPGVSVLRSARLPLKSGSMRGVVLSGEFGSDPGWVREGARVLLPGLRLVGEGAGPDPDLAEVIASAGGWWVATRRRMVPGRA